MKILIVPDSYKGTLSSAQVCSCIKKGIETTSDKNEITCMPFADGGEGFAECLSNICNGNILYTTCTDIYGNPKKCCIYTYGKYAIIDCAQASGLQKKKDVMNATSYGTGELIKYALSQGFRNIILGLGGSGCCDGGAGVLAALGAEFKDKCGNRIDHPKGRDIEKIHSIVLDNIVKDINFTFACDVENNYYDKNGAAYIFAKQKGANDEDVIHLDNGLKILNSLLPRDINHVKGSGAAGGICGGLYSVYGGEIKSGFDILSEAYNLEYCISQTDLVITGEGKTDKQTLMGKLPYKVFQIAEKYNKKCIIISGLIEGVEFGQKMISLVDKDTTIEESIKNPSKTLTKKAKNILK